MTGTLRRAALRRATDGTFGKLFHKVNGLCDLLEGVPVDPKSRTSPEMERGVRVDPSPPSVRDEPEAPAPFFVAELPHSHHNAPKGPVRRRCGLNE